ncbi:Inosine-5'-monophosphate dehydrogenase [Metallosphaera sp. J1]|uniref:CBS domain-containing protein n=1 Tax=Metallosphaera TaxID=41980 RepID=UPI001EDCF569|nr:CBS domain-containing protein [Metallosphaera javensis (ex Hofmann et al. 2022)]MCG3108597.1 Inosine-5'-monophosphate dehydrogenase [Metallosphaera javensis (ex Hofmann et al. 2022)]BCS91714.1 MAG: inosine-5'-monophosphate dehydrogenase [Metallosphaera javensis (ex Sakai et al. 2022)]
MIEGSEIISLDCSSTVLDTIFFMKTNRIRRIVVTCEGKMAGLFTVDEAMRQILERSVEDKLSNVKLKRIIQVKGDPLEIAKAMMQNSVDAVIVDGKIVTEKDLVRGYEWSDEERMFDLAVRAITVEGFTRLSTAAEIMVRNSIRHLPVVEDQPLGMISARDIVYRFSDKLTLQEEVKQVMVPYLVKGDTGISLRDGAELMMQKGVGSLIFSVDHSLYIVTLKDLIKHIYMYSMKV